MTYCQARSPLLDGAIFYCLRPVDHEPPHVGDLFGEEVEWDDE